MPNFIRSLRSRTLLAAGAAAAVAATGFSIPAQAAPALQEVMFVGNNWSGTATVIKSRGDFAKIAKEKSKDPVAAQQGGDLGYFTKDTMVEPFADAAFAMKKGEISKEPVKTQFGWHVIKVEDKRTQPQPTLDEVKPQLEQQLSKDIVNNVVDDLRKDAKVETYQLDGSPMPKAEEPKADAPKAEEPKK